MQVIQITAKIVCYHFVMGETILLGYVFRGYPSKEQKRSHNMTMGCNRKYWNLALSDFHDTGRIKTPASYKEEYPFLKEVDSLALANVQLDLQQTIGHFFKHICGEPNFKRKKYDESYTTTNQISKSGVSSIRIKNGHYLKLPKMKKPVRLKMHRRLPGKIHSVTVSRKSSGEYYYSILCEVPKPESPKTKETVGIDFGLKSFISDSKGNSTDPTMFYRDAQKKLAREQRKLSRMERANIDHYKTVNGHQVPVYRRPLRECRNYQKQRRKVARLHQHIANQRKDLLHKLSLQYVRDNDVICIENLNISGMMKNRHLSKAIADAGWNTFVSFLVYKADLYGRTVVKVSRWYPSSQTCSCCGYRLIGENKLKLSDRMWKCPQCGSEHDRDINAAINIRTEGLRLLEDTNSCVSVS